MKKLMIVLLAGVGQLCAAKLAPVENSGFYKAVDARDANGLIAAFNSNQVYGRQLKSNALGYLYMNLDIATLSPADQAKIAGMIGSLPADFSSNLNITGNNRAWLVGMNPAHALNTRLVGAPAGRAPAPVPVAPAPAPVAGGDDSGIPEAPPLDDEPAAKVKKERDDKHSRPAPVAGRPGAPSARELEEQRAKLRKQKADAEAKAKADDRAPVAGRPGVPTDRELEEQRAKLRKHKAADAGRRDADGGPISPELRRKLEKQREAVAGDDDDQSVADAANPWDE